MMRLFTNRIEAARLLAGKLMTYRGRFPLVLGIPRGAMPMASEIAHALDGELDVVLAHKIPAPGNSELAIGAESEGGHVYLNPELHLLRLPPAYLDEETTRQTSELRKRRILYTQVHNSIDPRGRVVIVVDDGVATGATTIAALRDVRARKPAELVIAVAVASGHVIRTLEQEADRAVVLIQASGMRSVGEFFEDFSQVSDEEVIRLLVKARTEAASSS